MKYHPIITMIAAVTVSVAGTAAERIPAPFEQALKQVTAIPRVPVLTGTEGFAVDRIREGFGDSGEVPLSAFQTAEDVLNGLAPVSTGSGRLTSLEIGLAALEYNWLVTTLVGDQALASSLASEITRVSAVYDSILNDVVYPSALVPFASVYYTRQEAGQLAMSLRRMAGSAIFEMHIPDLVDPEGYLRQRMRATYLRLTNTADLIMAAGDAYSYY